MPCGAMYYGETSLSTDNSVVYTHYTAWQGLCHHFCRIPSVKNATYNVKHSCISNLRLYHRFRLVNIVWCTKNLMFTLTFWTNVLLKVPASPIILNTTGSWWCKWMTSGSCITNQADMTAARQQLQKYQPMTHTCSAASARSIIL